MTDIDSKNAFQFLSSEKKVKRQVITQNELDEAKAKFFEAGGHISVLTYSNGHLVSCLKTEKEN